MIAVQQASPLTPSLLLNLIPDKIKRKNSRERAHKPRAPYSPLMRRKKHRGGGGGGGGGTELFICFTSRPSAAAAASVAAAGALSSLRPSNSSKLLSPGRGSAGAGAEAVPAPPLHPSLSRRLRNSGSLKGGQSPMFPSGSTGGGRRGRGGFEPAEPSSPKVTCIGQVRVKGGKRKPKHASAAALRSRSRRGGVGGGGSAEASFRRAGDDRDGPQGKNQGWVYQIPVNICEALKTFGSCGGRSLCSPTRPGGAGERGALSADAHCGKKRRQRAPAGGSWLCGAAVARCLLAIQEEEDDEVGKGAAVVPAEEMRASDVGLVMEGWDVEEEEKAVMVGEVELEKKDEILVVGKEEEGRVSVCIPPRNALLLMRCHSDPVRMAALATRFWGSPAAATVEQVGNVVAGGVDNNEEGGGEEEEETEPEECKDEARHSAVSVKDVNCGECGCGDIGVGEAGEIDQAQAKSEESSNCGDLVEEEKDVSCRVEVEEAQIVRKDSALEVSLGEDTAVVNEGLSMVELVVGKGEEDAPAQEKVEDDVKGRRSISSYSPLAGLKEDRNRLRRLSSRRRVSTSSRASSASDKVGRRHSFSAEMEARRSSFSSLKDSRRASFSIDKDGRRWSFSIEQEHLVAEPKVLMASRKGKKTSSEQESEKDCAVAVAPNSAEEGQESYDDGNEEETTKNGEEGETQTQGVETNQEVQKVKTRAEDAEAGPVVQRRKKSGELPDCLLLMMYEPKLSMEVSKETWVCSTDFVHWKSYQGKNNRYISTAINDGPGCLMLRCPDPSCAPAVGQDMINALANDEDKEKYGRYLRRSYIEDNRKTKLCPAPGCKYAVEFVMGSGSYDVNCNCSYGFCWNCTEEAHHPVDCATVSKWILKNSAESENMNWILANSKPCPKCKRPIEKNQGCMHISCTPPCKFEFCWLCLGPWSEHGERTGGFYACNRYESARQEGAYDESERRREMAKNSLERYTHYYERWAANQSSRQKALGDLQSLQNDKLEKLSDIQSQPDIIDAWLQIVECRRVLKWTYAYGFYLPEHEHAKREFFEYLQGEAESGLERLHQCAEKELQVYLEAESPSKDFNDFRTKLAGLTSTTRIYFENLVRALETGLNDVGPSTSHDTCNKSATSKSLGGKSESGENRASSTSFNSGGSNRDLDDSNIWTCDQCTFANPKSARACQACDRQHQ